MLFLTHTVVSLAVCSVEPFPQLLIAPALAIPRALDQVGLSMDDIDVVEIHEAFAAQVGATFRAIESQAFQDEFMPDRTAAGKKPVGRPKPERVNPHGSSIAVGHPFAATGGRLVIAAMNELRRSGKQRALLSVCAAGPFLPGPFAFRADTDSLSLSLFCRCRCSFWLFSKVDSEALESSRGKVRLRRLFEFRRFLRSSE